VADETLRFDIIGRDNASGAFSRVAASAKDMGGNMDVATRHALVLDEALKKQSAAARTSAEATLAAARADKILDDAERMAAKGALEAEYALKREAAAAKDAGDKSKAASGGVSALAGGGGMAGGGMGALIGAGVALAPVLITVGLGAAGLGVAAAGVVSPIEKAAKATGGLQANMGKLGPEQRKAAESLLSLQGTYHAFQKALAPAVLGDFNAGLRLAGHLMDSLAPVSAATGKALGGVLGQIDAEFQSGTWQQFFGFMAKNAGPDIQLLGTLFTSLLHSLPPLVEGLQPIATGLLNVSIDAAKAIGPVGQLLQTIDHNNHSIQQGAKNLDAWAVSLTNKIPGYKHVNDAITSLQHAVTGSGQAATTAGKATQALGGQQQSEAQKAAAQTAAINKLNAAMTANIAKVLTLEGDEVSWKQAQQAATTAVNQNKNALDGNSKSALAARSAIIQATSSVIKFADDSNVSTDALHRGSSALQNQIGWLEKHAGKSRIAAEEIKALREEEAKIKREIDQRIKVTGSGRFSVAGAGLPGGLGHHVGGGAAAGMYVSAGTTPTADDVLIRASRGELVVPTNLVNAGAVDHLRGQIPGFAGGGVVPSYSGGIPGLGPWAVGNTRAALGGFDQSIASAIARELRSMSAGLGSVAPASGSALAAQNYARSLLSMYGWSAGQMGSLVPLWNQESGWNAWAVNPSSGAYGIPQSLGHGHPYALGDYKNQVIWGLNYIRGRYGSPAGAEAHELAFGWYDQGGHLPTGLSLAYNGTGRPEPVGAAGGNTYNINISAMIADRNAGRLAVEAIKKYEAGSGKSWRS